MNQLLGEIKPIIGFENYLIGKDGQVTYTHSNKCVKSFLDLDGEVSVLLKKNGKGGRQVKVARVVLLHFGNISSEISYGTATIGYRDGNKLNTHYDNLVWDFDDEGYKPIFVPGGNIGIKSFLTIPGYTRYEINSLGEIRRKNDGTIVVPYVGTRGYLVATIIDDDGYRAPVKVHRLLALIFLPHPRDVSRLVVNHIDTNKLNNNLSNLEWVTNGYNIQHAYDNGLVQVKNRKVFAMNIDTREIVIFESVGECAKFFNVNYNTITDPLRNPKGIRPYKGHYLKYSDDLRSWPEKDEEFNVYQSKAVLAKNIETGEIQKFNSMQELGAFFGVSTSSIFNQVVSEKPRPYRGYLIRHASEHVDWIPQEGKRINHRGSKVFVVNTYTNDSIIYDSIKEASKNLKVPAETLYAAIYRKSPCGMFSVSYINKLDLTEEKIDC